MYFFPIYLCFDFLIHVSHTHHVISAYYVKPQLHCDSSINWVKNAFLRLRQYYVDIFVKTFQASLAASKLVTANTHYEQPSICGDHLHRL